MPASEACARYTTTAIVLHWVVALVVIGQITWGWWMQTIPKQPPGFRADAFNLHKSIGLTIFGLMAVRLAWRATHAPPPPVSMPAWQACAARINHWLLYACLLLQPMTGYIGSAVSGYPVRYFGWVLPSWASRNDVLKDLLSQVHLVTSVILVAAIALHVGAALKHQFVDRDRLLGRMWPRARAPAAD